MDLRGNARIKPLLLLLCLGTCGLLVLYYYQTDFQHYLKENGIQDMKYLKRVFVSKHRPKLWRNVSTASLLKIFWGTRNTRSNASLAACTQPAGASSDVTVPLNPLEKLLASEPSGHPKADPQYVAHYSRVWAWINNHTEEKKKRYARFGLKLTPELQAQLLFNWRVVHEALKLHGIYHFLIGGALIGAMRHGGMIPWDDDIDMAVDGSDMDKLIRVMSCIPGFTLRLDQSYHWKVFHSNSPVQKKYRKASLIHPRILTEAEKKHYAVDWHPKHDVVWRFPYVDLYPMNMDDSHVWCFNQQYTQKYLFPLGDVFPLEYVHFDGLHVPVPRRSLQILNAVYNQRECISYPKYHLFDKKAYVKELDFKRKHSINCSELAPIYRLKNVR